MSKTTFARFKIGQVIRHRVHEFRGVVLDVDPEFRELTHALILIEGQQCRDQPFYYLLAENDQNPHLAYVPEQNLQADSSTEPICHPQLDVLFERDEHGCYRRRDALLN